ncbi:Scavenger receptor class B member 1 [Eumeta japonica]|uniref:Scavenger receptor class B member 1 n=1 Tax=Eumeta variegata TaxID=151549 RepID=A0A4C1YLQ5_EUMVA|nr:Scavenger receptor class B member 1 [Eumeta japonica]
MLSAACLPHSVVLRGRHKAEFSFRQELVLRPGSMTFEWWAHPPVRPFINVYVYNVTNADEFLNNGSKPVLQELGPYVYSQEWEKVNITDNENGTLSFRYHRSYTFVPELSRGNSDDDAVIVPNIPMLGYFIVYGRATYCGQLGCTTLSQYGREVAAFAVAFLLRPVGADEPAGAARHRPALPVKATHKAARPHDDGAACRRSTDATVFNYSRSVVKKYAVIYFLLGILYNFAVHDGQEAYVSITSPARESRQHCCCLSLNNSAALSPTIFSFHIDGSGSEAVHAGHEGQGSEWRGAYDDSTPAVALWLKVTPSKREAPGSSIGELSDEILTQYDSLFASRSAAVTSVTTATGRPRYAVRARGPCPSARNQMIESMPCASTVVWIEKPETRKVQSAPFPPPMTQAVRHLRSAAASRFAVERCAVLASVTFNVSLRSTLIRSESATNEKPFALA